MTDKNHDRPIDQHSSKDTNPLEELSNLLQKRPDLRKTNKATETSYGSKTSSERGKKTSPEESLYDPEDNSNSVGSELEQSLEEILGLENNNSYSQKLFVEENQFQAKKSEEEKQPIKKETTEVLYSPEGLLEEKKTTPSPPSEPNKDVDLSAKKAFNFNTSLEKAPQGYARSPAKQNTYNSYNDHDRYQKSSDATLSPIQREEEKQNNEEILGQTWQQKSSLSNFYFEEAKATPPEDRHDFLNLSKERLSSRLEDNTDYAENFNIEKSSNDWKDSYSALDSVLNEFESSPELLHDNTTPEIDTFQFENEPVEAVSDFILPSSYGDDQVDETDHDFSYRDHDSQQFDAFDMSNTSEISDKHSSSLEPFEKVLENTINDVFQADPLIASSGYEADLPYTPNMQSQEQSNYNTMPYNLQEQEHSTDTYRLPFEEPNWDFEREKLFQNPVNLDPVGEYNLHDYKKKKFIRDNKINTQKLTYGIIFAFLLAIATIYFYVRSETVNTAPPIIRADTAPYKIASKKDDLDEENIPDIATYDQVAGEINKTKTQKALIDHTETLGDALSNQDNLKNFEYEDAASTGNMKQSDPSSMSVANQNFIKDKQSETLSEKDKTLAHEESRNNVSNIPEENTIKASSNLENKAEINPISDENLTSIKEGSIEKNIIPIKKPEEDAPAAIHSSEHTESAKDLNEKADKDTVFPKTVLVKPISEARNKRISPSSTFFVQLSAQPTIELARKSLKQIKDRYGYIINSFSILIQQTNIAGKGTFYRVRIPLEKKDYAVTLCERLKQAGASCFIAH